VAHLITARTITDGWREAVLALGAAPDREIYDLVIEVTDPQVLDQAALEEVDGYLIGAGMQSLDTVANTIFPARLAERSGTRDELYRRYERALPRIRRRDARNRRSGPYFSRMIGYPLQTDPARRNQVERVIHDLQVNPHRRMRHIYEVQIFAPGRDLRPQGFPCLSSISMHVEADAVRLAATYRNQYYVERGLGNFLGLARLQQWIASQAGLVSGAMSLHAFHAYLDRPIEEIRALVTPRATPGGD
jgi:thymidylate synthase